MVEITPTIKYVAALNPFEALDMLGFRYRPSLIAESSYWVTLPVTTKESALELIRDLGLRYCNPVGGLSNGFFADDEDCTIRVYAPNKA